MQKPTWAHFMELRGVIQRRPWSILSWSSGLIAATFIIYYGLQLPFSTTVGAQFVLSEWPDPKISPYFYAKPITWFAYFSFLYWAFGLESFKNRLLNLSPKVRRLLFIVTSTVAFGALYEIFFNFTLWSALMVLTNANCPTPPPCNPDLVASNYPALRNPLNLVFATKVVTTVFALSIYSLWLLHRIEKETENKSPNSDLG